MPVATSDYSTAIAHLPAAAVLRLDNVAWEEYEQLLADLGPGYAVRIFYDRGRMEIMAPSGAHEKRKGIIGRLMNALSDELDIDVESFGSTTFSSAQKAKGAEPDDSFFVTNAALVIGREYDIERLPAPDIAVEVDRSNASLDKFLIYAALGVPELWRVYKETVRIYLLRGDEYIESPTSGTFPFLEAKTLSKFLTIGLAEGGRRTAREFRTWLRENKAAFKPVDE